MSENEGTIDRLLAVAVEDPDSTQGVTAIGQLHRLGSRAVYGRAVSLMKCKNVAERVVAARIMGQIGLERGRFHAGTVSHLIDMLADVDAQVVAAACVALSHRHDPRAVPFLLQLLGDDHSNVRHGVAVALGGHDLQEAIDGLIVLSTDKDDEVRSWATLGLGSLTLVDNPSVRTALLARAADTIAEVRGEALIGLARRSDPGARDLVRAELGRPFSGDWAVEAAGILGDQIFGDELARLWSTLTAEDKKGFRESFERAMLACGGRVPVK